MATTPHLPEQWCVLRTYESLSAAEVDAGYLRSDGLAAEVQPELPGMGRGARLIVDAALAHRARWLLKLEPVTDAELEYLATGSLDHAAGEAQTPTKMAFPWWVVATAIFLIITLVMVGNVAI